MLFNQCFTFKPANITLCQCLLFVTLILSVLSPWGQCTPIVCDAGQTMKHHWLNGSCLLRRVCPLWGGGPRVVVSTAAFHARVRGSVPGLGGLKETKMFLPHPRVKVSSVGSLRDREVACSASDRQGSNFEFCVWRTVSSQSSHHPQEVLLAQFSLYVHKSGLKPDSFHFCALCALRMRGTDFTFRVLEYFCMNHEDQRFFFNLKSSYICLS